jgi:hypothetical protein
VLKDWDNTNPDYSGASFTYKVFVDGVDETSTWQIRANIRRDTSSATFTVTRGSVNFTATDNQNNDLFVTIGKPGFPTQLLEYPIQVTRRARPAQVASIDKPLITLAGDIDGTATSYTGAVCTGKVMEGSTDATSTYTWSHTASSGLTVSRTGAVVTVTNMTAATDSATIVLTGTKSSWPTVVLQCVVNKTRLLPVSGAPVAQMPGRTAYAGSSSTTSAKVRFRTDGTVQVWDDVSGVWAASGNWYFPTTTNIGNTHYLRMTTSSPLAAATGTFNSWLQINSDREFSLTNPGGSGSNIVTALALISTSSTGATIGGQGSVTLIAESFGS